ncbi:MAG: carbohydrate ABC transporter permease [Spirochaetota bacterium]
MIENITNKKTPLKLISIIEITVIISVGLIAFVPYLWMFLSGFKERTDILAVTPRFFFKPTLVNFPAVFIEAEFIIYLRNSIVTAVFAVILCLLVGIPAAYSFSRFHILGKKHLFFYFLTTRMCPGVAEALPLYIIFSKIGLLGTTPGLVLAHCTFIVAFVIWVMKAFFDDIPEVLDDAALTDGYSEWGAFIHAILPIVKPAVAATALLAFIFSWNEFLFSLILGGHFARTLPAGFPGLVTPHGTYWGQLCAAAGVVTIPIIILAALLQRYLIRGLSLGAVKG